MQTRDEFAQQLRDALNHLYDFSYLDGHWLALQYWPDAVGEGPSRGHRLHRLLLETISALLPLDGSVHDSRRARWHSLVVARYVEEWPLERILHELGCSRRQFFREQHEAIAMLANLLQERHPLTMPQSPGPVDQVAAEAKRVLAQREIVEAAQVAHGVLATVNHLATERSVNLECSLSPHLPPVVANRTLLRQVLLKALSDLITQPGSRRVCLHMHPEGKAVAVVIKSELRPGAEAASSDLAGLGPVRRLVEIFGGRWLGTEVESQGCAYRFALPIADASQKVLLVVEDNEAVIRAFRRYLAGHDYHVVGATTGAEALRLARELCPTAITLDVMMPSQDGWETLQALKNDPLTSHIPVVICSVLIGRHLAHSLGAAAYLEKPVTQSNLVAVLASLRAALP